MSTRPRIPRPAAGLAAAALLAAATHAPARAVDTSGSFAIHGIGAVTCSALTSGLLQGREDLRQTLAAWLTGYLSATNRLRSETYDVTPIQQPAALATMIVNLCVSNPDVLVETAASSLVEALSVAAAASETPQQEVAVDDRTVRVRLSTLQQVQEALIARDLMSEPANGTFGAATETALREYQAGAGLAETGLPDPATIMQLLVGSGAENGQQDGAPAGN